MLSVTTRRRLQAFYHWLDRRFDLALLLGALAIAGAFWGFLEVADEVSEGSTHAVDEMLVRALRDPADPSRPLGPRWVGEITRDLTALGGIPVLMMLSAMVAGYLLLARKVHALGLLTAAVLGGTALSLGLKELFDRPRPELVPHLSHVYTSSFPSGHSMMATVVYLTLGVLLARLVTQKRFKVYFIGVALVLSGLVGVSRVYMGVHYPTDVLAGWTAGLAWALLCWVLARWLQHRGKVEPPEPVPEAGAKQ